MSLVDKLKKRLEGGKFRLLNEKMYKNKELNEKEAKEYHTYYKSQLKKWPNDPKKMIIEKIKEAELSNAKIADLGCGSAEIAESFANVTSFDKYPINSKVIKCELKSIPAEEKDFDVTVCCLSLMMTGITGVLKEINRILKVEGLFYLAEVTSRVKNMKKFINDVEKLGFKLKNIDKSNSYFFIIVFQKISDVEENKKLPNVKLGEWNYKKR